jgi:hypothetical protein
MRYACITSFVMNDPARKSNGLLENIVIKPH